MPKATAQEIGLAVRYGHAGRMGGGVWPANVRNALRGQAWRQRRNACLKALATHESRVKANLVTPQTIDHRSAQTSSHFSAREIPRLIAKETHEERMQVSTSTCRRCLHKVRQITQHRISQLSQFSWPTHPRWRCGETSIEQRRNVGRRDGISHRMHRKCRRDTRLSGHERKPMRLPNATPRVVAPFLERLHSRRAVFL